MSYFWSGVTLDDFLIQGLNITSYQGFATLILVVIVASAFYEGIRTCRDVLMARFRQLQRRELLFAGTKTFEVRYASNTTTLSAGNRKATTELSPSNGNSSTCKTSSPQTAVGMNVGMNVDVDGVLSSAKRWSSCLMLLAATTCHMAYVFLGYTLMLCAMTFNVWILWGVAFGGGCGYFIFFHLKQFMTPREKLMT